MRRAWLLALAGACASNPGAGSADRKAAPDPGCAWSAPRKVATIEVDGLTEASGLVASRAYPGMYFSLNDSGNPAELMSFDGDGAWLGTWRLKGVSNVDWEDLGVGPCAPDDLSECLFVADIGDNEALRTFLAIHVVRTPAPPASPMSVELEAERTIHFRYPDGARDAESLLVDPADGTPYVVAKRPVPEPDVRGVYRITGDPDSHDVVTAVRIGALVPPPSSDGLFTGGAVAPDGRRVLLRTYTSAVEYAVEDGAPFESFLESEPSTLPVGGSAEAQGEAITYDAAGGAIYTTSEGRRPPLNRRDCEP